MPNWQIGVTCFYDWKRTMKKNYSLSYSAKSTKPATVYIVGYTCWRHVFLTEQWTHRKAFCNIIVRKQTLNNIGIVQCKIIGVNYTLISTFSTWTFKFLIFPNYYPIKFNRLFYKSFKIWNISVRVLTLRFH